MSSAKRPYNETISSNSSNSTSLNSNIVNATVEEKKVEEMDIEEQISEQPDSFKNQQVEENYARRKTRRYSSSGNTTSNTPNSITPFSGNTTSCEVLTTYNPPSPENVNYISPKDSFNNSFNNTYNNESSKSTKVSEDMKVLSPIDLLMSSPPISTSTPKQTNQTRNISNSSLTLTRQYSADAWDLNNNDILNYNGFNDSIIIRTKLTETASNGPFSPVYSQIYDTDGIVRDTESFNYLIQIYEFCDNSSTQLQSNITSTLRDLVLYLAEQLDGFEIALIEHHKWNGSHFYGPIDVADFLDQLDDGLGLSSTEHVFYDRNNIMRPAGSVLQCSYRRTPRKNETRLSESESSTFSSHTITSDQSNNCLQNNDLRHAVLDSDDEKRTRDLLESLAEEEENDVEDNSTEQDESDSFTEISKESDDDDDSLIRGFASASIQRRIDTFGNPINQTRTTSTRLISRPSVDNDGNETDDDYIVDNGNLSESTFEEIDMSDIESIATDSTADDWHNVSRDNL